MMAYWKIVFVQHFGCRAVAVERELAYLNELVVYVDFDLGSVFFLVSPRLVEAAADNDTVTVKRDGADIGYLAAYVPEFHRPVTFETLLIAYRFRGLNRDGHVVLPYLAAIAGDDLETLFERQVGSTVKRSGSEWERSVNHRDERVCPVLRDIAVSNHRSENSGSRCRVAVRVGAAAT